MVPPLMTARAFQEINVDLEDDVSLQHQISRMMTHVIAGQLIAHLEIHYPPFRRIIVSHLGSLLESVSIVAQYFSVLVSQIFLV